jgi:hypothetical protein
MTFARALVAAILLLQASVAYAAVAFDAVGMVQHSGSATSVPSSALPDTVQLIISPGFDYTVR